MHLTIPVHISPHLSLGLLADPHHFSIVNKTCEQAFMLLLFLTVTKYSGDWLIGLDWLSACASLDVDGESQVSVVEDVS